MTCLILDTSTDQCLMALTKENQLVAQEIYPHENLLSSRLLPGIRTFVETHCQSQKNLSAIAVGIGPGSYTGTRLGVAVAKSLAFALQVPLKTFSSPFAFLPDRKGSFALLIPARSGLYYVLSGSVPFIALTQSDGSILNALELEKIEDVDFLICATPDDLPPALKKKLTFPAVPNLPSLSHFLSGKEASPLEDVELLYLGTPIQKNPSQNSLKFRF
jgi:tRNA threonylcarbamoyladenosine biosynthesis protein TsaB